MQRYREHYYSIDMQDGRYLANIYANDRATLLHTTDSYLTRKESELIARIVIDYTIKIESR